MTDTNPRPYTVEPTEQKKQMVEDLTDKLGRSSAAFLFDYRGLTVSDMNGLRRQFDETSVDFHVVKNTLLRIAAAANGQDFGDLLSGPTAITIVYDDPVAPAKIMSDYIVTHREVSIKGGMLNGRMISADQVTALAKIPSREVLLSQLLAGFQGPVSGLVGTLSGILSSFVFTLQAVADKKTEAGTA